MEALLWKKKKNGEKSDIQMENKDFERINIVAQLSRAWLLHNKQQIDINIYLDRQAMEWNVRGQNKVMEVSSPQGKVRQSYFYNKGVSHWIPNL